MYFLQSIIVRQKERKEAEMGNAAPYRLVKAQLLWIL